MRGLSFLKYCVDTFIVHHCYITNVNINNSITYLHLIILANTRLTRILHFAVYVYDVIGLKVCELVQLF